jgi:hypothetical protein
MSIGYKSKNKKLIIELVQWLIDEKFTGKEINYGTYLPDSIPITDVFDLIELTKDENGDETIIGISVSKDEEERNKTKFPHLFNKNGILTSLIPECDLQEGDCPKKFYSKENFKKEVKKLV